MRVLFTDHFVRRRDPKAGVGHYAHELACALRRRLGPDAVCSWQAGVWMKVRQRWLDRQSRRYELAARRPGRLAWAEMKIRGRVLATVRRAFPSMHAPYRHALAQTGCDVYHEPNFIPHAMPLPTVVSVHDLSAIRFPEWHPPARVAAFEQGFARGLTVATHLVAISEFGKSEIVKHLGWPADKVSVTYMGVRPGLHPVAGEELAAGLKALGLSPGYLLHVGTVEPRKNLMMLLRAYAALPNAVREKHPLVLVGKRGWRCEEVHEYIQVEGRAKNVRWLGYVPDHLFPALYSGARALAFPTFYEGFGMPTVEMMACGGAVLASTAGAVAETAGPKAHLTDPHDEPGWRDAMLRACTDDDWLNGLRTGAEAHAAQYTWDRCAEQSVAAYRLAIDQWNEAPKADVAKAA